ncbi:MAG: hypothetical protein RQ754_02860 [Desulfuromonadales bacterium]|nr:hypothetical protein [Desulfuromonadales bacterium]
MKSEVDLCNLALFRIGVTTTIASLTERSKEAIVCNGVYENVRDKVLEAAPWPFARKFADLQLTGDAPDRWAYRYQYPTDCLAVRSVLPPVPSGLSQIAYRQWLQQYQVPYELSEGDEGLTICTDCEESNIEYTVRVTNPMRFSAKFTSALAWALAAEIAIPLAKGIDYAKNAAAMYEKELFETLAKMFNEEQSDEDPESEFVRARY